MLDPDEISGEIEGSHGMVDTYAHTQGIGNKWTVHLTFGGTTPLADLAEAIADITGDAAIDEIETTYFCDKAGCEGRGRRKGRHVYPVTTMTLHGASFGKDEAEAA